MSRTTAQRVAVRPYDPERSVALMVLMPQPPVMLSGEPDLLEVIAGRIEGADPEVEARRKAAEEAGVRLGPLEPVTKLWTMPSISTERVHLYLATFAQADRIGPGGGAANENEGITVHEVPLRRLGEMARGGDLLDAKTLVLVQALQLRRPDLFDSSSEPPQARVCATAFSRDARALCQGMFDRSLLRERCAL